MRQRHKILRTQLFPNVSLNGNYNEFIQDTRVAFFDNFIPASEIKDAKTTGLNGSLNANFSLTKFIQAFVQTKSNNQDRSALEQNNIAESNRLLMLVAQTFLDGYMSQSLVKINKLKLEDSKRIADLSDIKIKLGSIDSLEFYQAQINLQNDLVAFRESSTLLTEYLNSLRIWTGKSLESGLRLEELKHSSPQYNPMSPRLRAIEFEMAAQKSQYQSDFWNFVTRTFPFFQDMDIPTNPFKTALLHKIGLSGSRMV